MSFQKQLDDFNRKLDVASWYMGISTTQENAIYTMHEKLRDDFDQSTGSNMHRALRDLGIMPMLTTNQIKRLVQLSRNNILAFLFFALEGYYKTCRTDNVYSVNEQLLMVSIAKIDLLPTLRGLNAILPPPQLNPLEIRRYKRAQQKTQVSGTPSPVAAEAPAKKPPKKDPYFQSQPKPVHRNSKLTTQLPDFVVAFRFWPRNGPPNYGEEKEEPWFAKYRLNPGQRLIKNTLSEALERYFKQGGAESNKDDEDGTKSREPQGNMCLVHKGMLGQAQLLRDELTVKARDRCLELLDVTQPYSRLRQKRIVAQLEHDIDLIMDRHNRAMHCDQTKVLTIENTDCVLCQQMLVSQPWPEPNDQVGRALVGEDCGMAHTAALDSYRGRRLEGGAGKKKNKGKDKKPKKTNSDKRKTQSLPLEPPKKEPPKKREPAWKPPPRKLHNEPFCITKIDFKEKMKKCQPLPKLTECDVPPAPKKSAVSFAMGMGKIPKKDHTCDMLTPVKGRVKKKFFRGPRSNKPYRFKYHRVLQPGQPRRFDLNRVLTTSFVKALDLSRSDDPTDVTNLAELVAEEVATPGFGPAEQCQSQEVKEPMPEPEKFEPLFDEEEKTDRDSCDTPDRSSTHSRRSHVDHKAQIVEAVVRCANTLWKRLAAIKRAEMVRQEQIALRRALAFEDDEKFDPDNAEQMNQLLKEGLRVLRQDPRYVLASLPDSHKMPVLREWVKRRYGKAYSQKEMQTSLAESTRIFELVTLVQGNMPNPDLMGLDRLPRSQENFDYYRGIKQTAANVKRAFHAQMNDRYLNSMSAAWYAMGNYLVEGGPPRRTFFAYIGSNPQEIMRAKTWNGDFRNYRMMRDRRKEAEKAIGKID